MITVPVEHTVGIAALCPQLLCSIHYSNSFPGFALVLDGLSEVCLNSLYTFNGINIKATETQKGFKMITVLTDSLLGSERERCGVNSLCPGNCS